MEQSYWAVRSKNDRTTLRCVCAFRNDAQAKFDEMRRSGDGEEYEMVLLITAASAATAHHNTSVLPMPTASQGYTVGSQIHDLARRVTQLESESQMNLSEALAAERSRSSTLESQLNWQVNICNYYMLELERVKGKPRPKDCVSIEPTDSLTPRPSEP